MKWFQERKKKVIIIITILKHDQPKKNLALNFLASYDDVIFSKNWYKLIKLVCVELKTWLHYYFIDKKKLSRD